MEFSRDREIRISKWTWVRVPAIADYVPMHELDLENLEQLHDAAGALIQDRIIARQQLSMPLCECETNGTERRIA